MLDLVHWTLLLVYCYDTDYVHACLRLIVSKLWEMHDVHTGLQVVDMYNHTKPMTACMHGSVLYTESLSVHCVMLLVNCEVHICIYMASYTSTVYHAINWLYRDIRGDTDNDDMSLAIANHVCTYMYHELAVLLWGERAKRLCTLLTLCPRTLLGYASTATSIMGTAFENITWTNSHLRAAQWNSGVHACKTVISKK